MIFFFQQFTLELCMIHLTRCNFSFELHSQLLRNEQNKEMKKSLSFTGCYFIFLSALHLLFFYVSCYIFFSLVFSLLFLIYYFYFLFFFPLSFSLRFPFSFSSSSISLFLCVFASFFPLGFYISIFLLVSFQVRINNLHLRNKK